MIKGLNSQTSDISELLKKSSSNHRQVYQYSGLVSLKRFNYNLFSLHHI